jgi:hypothetical protein
LDYTPGGLVLLAKNPADKEVPEHIDGLLQQLKERPDEETFKAWSRARCSHMVSKPWVQWELAFELALGARFRPERLVWLNVVPYRTVGNAELDEPSLEHGRTRHLAPLLVLLEPARIVTRYHVAKNALRAMPGSPPWKQDLDRLRIRDLPDRSHRPNPQDISTVRATLDSLVAAEVLVP